MLTCCRSLSRDCSPYPRHLNTPCGPFQVAHNLAKPRLNEIRGLPRGECKDLAPVVTAVKQGYRFPARHGVSESRPFGEDMVLKVRLRSRLEER